MLFPNALFVLTKFPKLVKNSIFLLHFHHKFSKFSQNFPIICVFRPNARKINPLIVNFFEKYAKIMHFSNFLKKFLKIFEKFIRISNKFVFRQNARKINAWIVNFFEKYAKIMHFSQFS